MMMSSEKSADRPLTGRMVLACILGFFAVIIAVNITMMALAIETLPGTDVDNPYRAGLAYNQEIFAARAQEQRGWRIAAHIEREPDGRGDLRIDARDAGGAPLTGLIFSAQLARPIDRRADQAVTLKEREAGVYRGTAADLAAGQWDLIIAAERGGERMFLSRNRLLLR